MISRSYRVEIKPSPMQRRYFWDWGNKLRGIWNWVTDEDQYRWILSRLEDPTSDMPEPVRKSLTFQASKTATRWERRGRVLGPKLEREDGKPLPFYARVTGERAEPWMKGVPASAIAQMGRDHLQAWRTFAKRRKSGQGPPRPHKMTGRVSFSLQGVRFEDDWHIRVPVPAGTPKEDKPALAEPVRLARPTGWMLRSGQPRPWKPASGDVCTISCVAGRWYASFPAPEHHPVCPRDEQRAARGIVQSEVISVDLRTTGCRAWDGEKTWWYELPRSLPELDQLIDAQRRVLSTKIEARKRQPGTPRSKRYMRELHRLRQLCARQARIRRDWLDKVTYDLILRGKKIVCEVLDVSSMTQSAAGTEEKPGSAVALRASWNRRILSASFYAFRTLLKQKGLWHNVDVIEIPAHFTSRDCSTCKSRNRLRKIGAEVEYRCKACGMTMMQSENACRNILSRYTDQDAA